MYNPNANSDNTYQWDGTMVFEYRYAELLLNFAEDAQLFTGHPSEAVKLIGDVRERIAQIFAQTAKMVLTDWVIFPINMKR